MLVYVSHPYSNKEENKQKIEQIVTKLSQEHTENVYVSPVHCFGFMYSDFTYERGLEMCLSLLEKCDSMLVYGLWKESRGCNGEVLFAEMNMIPYEIVEDNE